MKRPEKKIYSKESGKGYLFYTADREYVDTYNQCHDEHTPYIKHLKKKPSVEEIEKVINNNEIGKLAWHYDIEKQIKKVAQAIDKLNNKEE